MNGSRRTLSRRNCRNRSRDLHAGARDAGFTLVELLVVVAIVGALAAVTVPSMLRARMSANEMAAVATMRAVNSAQVSYSASAAGGGYAVELATLGRSCTAGTPGFLAADLASNTAVKHGYRYEMRAASVSNAGPTDCNGLATRTGYYTTSVPISTASGGQKAFASSAAGSIYVSMSSVPPTEAAMLPGGGGTVIQ